MKFGPLQALMDAKKAPPLKTSQKKAKGKAINRNSDFGLIDLWEWYWI